MKTSTSQYGGQHYKVRFVRDGDSKVRENFVQRADEADVRRKLANEGYIVLSIEAQHQNRGAGALAFFARRSQEQIALNRSAYALLCKEIRTLMRAGMTVVEAVDTLSSRDHGRGLASMLLRRLEQGIALSSALAELAQTPAVLVAAVRSGERTSQLPAALEEYLRFDTLVSGLRTKVISAAIYPALVSAIGLGISVFLLLVVMPKFSAMYDTVFTANTAGASGGAAFAVALTHFIGKHRLVVFLVFFSGALAFTVWLASGRAKRHAFALLNELPWLRAKVNDFHLAMMYQALALLLKGGYPMTEAIDVSSKAAISLPLRSGLQEARLCIERGERVSVAMAEQGLCDAVGQRLMAAAERNGDFYLVADVLSVMHAERFELFIERLTRIVEPVLLLAVALMVGAIVILMYMPVFDMATQLL